MAARSPATQGGRVPVVRRHDVLAARVAVHGLHRRTAVADLAGLAVLHLGVQQSSPRGGLLALSSRAGEPLRELPDGLVELWSTRGAPHLHPVGEVPRIAAGLRPADDADAAIRLGANAAKALAQAGRPALAALDQVSAVLADLVGDAPGPLAKAAVSAAVTAALPSEFSSWCGGCGATHVFEQTLRVAAPGARAYIATSRPLALALLSDDGDRPDPVAARRSLVLDHLRLHGPTTVADTAAYFGARPAAVREVWPVDGLVAVDVLDGDDGPPRRAEVAAADLSGLLDPPEPPPVRLLAPYDPFLQSRDREVLVPDRARQHQVWRALGNPGVLLLDGVPAGTWRATGSARRTSVAVDAWAPVDGADRAALEDEAGRIAWARGTADAEVTVAGP